ncbi:MAG: hypothetical protein OXC46_12095 [Thaumarchaeota archaeon]|nr:hypothetical protein [Nitrososphaerota archaeon]
MLNQVYNENCIDAISRMFSESVALILTDPPYNITQCDFEQHITIPMYNEMKRISKSNGWMFVFGTFEISLHYCVLNTLTN